MTKNSRIHELLKQLDELRREVDRLEKVPNYPCRRAHASATNALALPSSMCWVSAYILLGALLALSLRKSSLIRVLRVAEVNTWLTLSTPICLSGGDSEVV